MASKGSGVDDNTTKLVERHRNIQELLSEDLAGLASQLKQTVRTIDSAVDQRGNLLDLTEDALVKSSLGVEESLQKQKEVKKSARLGFCRQLLLMLFVIGTFFSMWAFIKTTHIMGYRAHKRRGRGPPSPGALAAPPGPPSEYAVKRIQLPKGTGATGPLPSGRSGGGATPGAAGPDASAAAHGHQGQGKGQAGKHGAGLPEGGEGGSGLAGGRGGAPKGGVSQAQAHGGGGGGAAGGAGAQGTGSGAKGAKGEL